MSEHYERLHHAVSWRFFLQFRLLFLCVVSLILIKFIFPFFLSQNHSHKKYTHQMIKICKFAANFTATKCSACGTCTTSYVYCAYKYFIRQHLHTIYTYSSACERGSTDISAIFSLVLNPSWELFFSLLLQNKQSADCLRSCVCVLCSVRWCNVICRMNAILVQFQSAQSLTDFPFR